MDNAIDRRAPTSSARRTLHLGLIDAVLISIERQTAKTVEWTAQRLTAQFGVTDWAMDKMSMPADLRMRTMPTRKSV